MNKVVLLAALFITLFGYAQNDIVHTNPETKAEFPGGLSEFYAFIGANFNNPKVEKDTEFKFYVNFIVGTDGALTDINIIRDPGLGIGDEALRVLKLSPKWNPATQDGIAVRYKTTLPVIISAKANDVQNREQEFLDDVKRRQELADIKPEFPGGNGEFNIEVYKWMKLPDVDSDINVVTYVYFIVSTDGSIKDIKCIYDPGHGVGEEAVKAFQKVKTKWKPARRDGNSIDYPLILPIRITATSNTNRIADFDYNEIEQAEAEYTKPMYPGGTEKFHEDFFRKFNAPEVSAAVNEVVQLRFTINPDGTMSNIECTRDPGFGLGMECVKALQMLKRKWIPATKDGNAIAYNVSVPMRITIDAGSGPKEWKSQKINREVGPPVNRNGLEQRLERTYRQR